MTIHVTNEHMVCDDCRMVIANADYSGLSLLDEPEGEQRAQEINRGLDKLGHVYPGDATRDDEFSSAPCDCCGTTLAGARHHCVTLEDDQC